MSCIKFWLHSIQCKYFMGDYLLSLFWQPSQEKLMIYKMVLKIIKQMKMCTCFPHEELIIARKKENLEKLACLVCQESLQPRRYNNNFNISQLGHLVIQSGKRTFQVQAHENYMDWTHAYMEQGMWESGVCAQRTIILLYCLYAKVF